jgi:hypothetical protein
MVYYLPESQSAVVGLLSGLSSSQSQSHVKTDDQSASLSWNKAPIWGFRPDFHYCQKIAGLTVMKIWSYKPHFAFNPSARTT